MATLRYPFTVAVPSLPALALKIMKGVYPPIPSSVDKGVKTLIESMIIVDPSQRPSVLSLMGYSFLKPFLGPEIFRLMGQRDSTETSSSNKDKMLKTASYFNKQSSRKVSQYPRQIYLTKKPALPKFDSVLKPSNQKISKPSSANTAKMPPISSPQKPGSKIPSSSR